MTVFAYLISYFYSLLFKNVQLPLPSRPPRPISCTYFSRLSTMIYTLCTSGGLTPIPNVTVAIKHDCLENDWLMCTTVYVAIRHPRTHAVTHVRVSMRMHKPGKDCQRSPHVNLKCSSPNKVQLHAWSSQGVFETDQPCR